MIDYHKGWLDKEAADELFTVGQQLPLSQLSAYFPSVGQVPFPRLICWMSDSGEGYGYSGQTTPVSPWTPWLLELRTRLERETGYRLPTCLVNYYRSGSDSVGWHRDDEEIFGDKPSIISLSLGATRKFVLRNKEAKEKISFELAHGDLLVLTGTHVETWEHTIPKTSKPVGPRLNFTFRSIE